MKSVYFFIGMLLISGLLVAQDARQDRRVVEWPAGKGLRGRLELDMRKDSAIIRGLWVVRGGGAAAEGGATARGGPTARGGAVAGGAAIEIVRGVEPGFFLRVGKRDLVSQNGWNIFFDKVPGKGYQSYPIRLEKRSYTVSRGKGQTVVRVDGMEAPGFNGALEITLYHGSLLMNIAAVMTTMRDSTAILYDAGLVWRGGLSGPAGWYDVEEKWHSDAVGAGGAFHPLAPGADDSAHTEAVKYRAIGSGHVVVFPPPHQYFYPLDEAFNLRFVWHSAQGLGIRQDPEGDHRYVPWFNAPPGTKQRLNFFCLFDTTALQSVMEEVKAYTRGDRYKPLEGYKTFSSHFHNEFTMKVVLAGKPVPEQPDFVQYFKDAGIDIVHLAEFHGPGHPKGPDEDRLKELDALFAQCRRLSDGRLLLLPGEEPNEFFGGHWLAFFPHPVYWVMSHPAGKAFLYTDPVYGKVYHVGNAQEMLQLLNLEQGLAWTAHPRTKGSTGFPDAYKNEPFFKADRWLGGAWKALPADLSQPRLGKRVFDLMDDMNNWGVKKRVLAEADLFTINKANEMYAHMNVNYLLLPSLPSFDKGWESVLDCLREGRFFSTTGEVLIPSFSVEGGQAVFTVEWTFPLRFAELVSGDGKSVFRQRIPMEGVGAFGKKSFRVKMDGQGLKWVRLEVWDIAADGAFSQTVFLRH